MRVRRIAGQYVRSGQEVCGGEDPTPQQQAAVSDEPVLELLALLPPAVPVVGKRSGQETPILHARPNERGEVVARIRFPADGAGELPRILERVVSPRMARQRPARPAVYGASVEVDVERSGYLSGGHERPQELVGSPDPGIGGPDDVVPDPPCCIIPAEIVTKCVQLCFGVESHTVSYDLVVNCRNQASIPLLEYISTPV